MKDAVSLGIELAHIGRCVFWRSRLVREGELLSVDREDLLVVAGQILHRAHRGRQLGRGIRAERRGLLARALISSICASGLILRRLFGFLPERTLSQACANSCRRSLTAEPFANEAGLIRTTRN